MLRVGRRFFSLRFFFVRTGVSKEKNIPWHMPEASPLSSPYSPFEISHFRSHPSTFSLRVRSVLPHSSLCDNFPKCDCETKKFTGCAVMMMIGGGGGRAWWKNGW